MNLLANLSIHAFQVPEPCWRHAQSLCNLYKDQWWQGAIRVIIIARKIGLIISVMIPSHPWFSVAHVFGVWVRSYRGAGLILPVNSVIFPNLPLAKTLTAEDATRVAFDCLGGVFELGTL